MGFTPGVSVRQDCVRGVLCTFYPLSASTFTSKVFFEHLELPQPDIYLGVGRGALRQAQDKRSRRKGIALTYPWIKAQVKTARQAK